MQQGGFCTVCGRWAGRVPGGIIAIAVLALINSAAGCMGSMAIITAFSDPYASSSPSNLGALVGFSAIVDLCISILQVVLAINLIRLRQWAYKVFRVLLIIAIVLSVLDLVMSLLSRPNPIELLITVVAIVINGAILTYLRNKDHLFASNTGSGSTPAPARRRCPFCGNEKLTSFDNICPQCKRSLA
jgi:hypothetical protein